MRKIVITVASVLAGFACATAAAAQVAVVDETVPLKEVTISGGIDLKSRYVLDDLLIGTDEPVIQGWASIPVNGRCSAELWGSHGISTSTGAELDIGGKCRLTGDDESYSELEVSRYLLKGTDDMTAVSLNFKSGGFDASVSQYFWDKNPDATQVQVGYSTELSERVSARVLATYETGFGLPDIGVIGAELDYSLTDTLSVGFKGLVPVKKSGRDDRGTEVVFNLSYAF
ncbi:MAG TPA: hypothetical protein VGE31_00460 [Candidatus Paceibacterota bacterium]